MPRRCSNWPSSRPAGPEPMMATCVRMAFPDRDSAVSRLRRLAAFRLWRNGALCALRPVRPQWRVIGGNRMFEESLPRHKIGVLAPLGVLDNGPFEFYR